MERMQKAMKRVQTFVRNRAVAVSALIAAVLVMIGYVSLNLRTVSISDGEQSRKLMSFSTDAGWILKAAGLTVDAEDKVTEDWQFARGEITVERAFEVTVSVDGVTRSVKMTEGTVADALKKAAITLGADDVVSMAQDTELTDSVTLTVDRVTYRERTETSEIAYTTERHETAELNEGDTRVETAGENGEMLTTYREKLVNGEVAESTKIGEQITKEAVNEVVLVGTYVAPTLSVNASGSGSTDSFTYSRVYTGSGTAYTNENGLASQYTASGMLAQRGVVAVDPSVIPYGTRLYIATADGSYPDYGYCIAGDTGGFVGTGTVADLFYPTLAECVAFGRRDIIVYVLD